MAVGRVSTLVRCHCGGVAVAVGKVSTLVRCHCGGSVWR